ncbi:DNA phosphorothioation-dependent restriction protein DptG [Sphingobacterium phlebotomi]|uniref:DNA phosphorothioation-dependent restriction protein DptG n=1 Tax=Sphingobacterium phlebotomi TaxID=2605433 RepID=A0A5D4H866_9SPHI|nr:DNA phosphorothioation-dependent restriction protein DptG [Sphingobacterium phlebotomi]TYR36159.1 DNA phosphorothioation-dependent restriction protein DptG [Sphingobacterium phlebotomi]
MRKIELRLEGKSGLKSRSLKQNAFQHHTGYQVNIFPFKTQPGGHIFKADFSSFQGIMGDVIRLSQKKDMHKPKDNVSYKADLKSTILRNALQKVDTNESLHLEDILSKLYFDTEDGLFKYDFNVISYMNFITTKAAIKDIPIFISDVFIEGNDRFKSLLSSKGNDNILNQLISESLPAQTERKESERDKRVFKNMIPAVVSIFQKDFNFLLDNKEYFLQNFEQFFKYYYFFYFSQLVLKLHEFGRETYTIKPIYFSLEWENLSESRMGLHKPGWQELSKQYDRVFAHANTLELINYIRVDDEILGDYDEISFRYNAFEDEEKDAFKNCLTELLDFYKVEVKTLIPPANWGECQAQLEASLENRKFDEEITKLIYSLWYTIRYQFENGKRKKPYRDYALWISTFAKENFTKSGGRLGPKFVLTQELLLFLTKLCVGEQQKIRLKDYWTKLQERGLAFDETSKLEIVKLFERINLIEKKSDSGDAQYIKSSL